jgi:ribosomal protein S18 acetylase RimI-like enzyme
LSLFGSTLERDDLAAERPLVASEAGSAFRLFDRLTSGLPHGFAVPEERFSRFLWDTPRHLRKWATLASVRDGEVLAFARVGAYRPVNLWSHAEEGDGLLFGPWFIRGNEGAAAEVMEMAEAWSQRNRSHLLFAFDHVEAATFPEFHGGWSGLSERLSHIAGFLSRAGFRICRRELCLSRSLVSPFRPASPVSGLSASMSETDGRFSLTAREGRHDVGACNFALMHPARACDPAASRCGYVDGLRVDDRRRGRGIGRWLVTRALEEMTRLGCEECRLTTGSENFTAQNLYYSLGFEVRDSAISFERFRW